jgi:adenine-specific DNA-methyltransferase
MLLFSFPLLGLQTCVLLSLEPKIGFVEVMPAKYMGIQTVWRWGKSKSEENLNINIVGKAMKEN